jgi:hypothetical protein
MMTSSSQNKGIWVTYRTPPTKDLQNMALIAMIRGKPNNNNNTQNYTSYSICRTPLPGADPKSFHNAMQLAKQDCFGTYFLQLDGPFHPFNII